MMAAGCGLEMPDWFDEKNFAYFRQWSGEVRLLQNISVKRQVVGFFVVIFITISLVIYQFHCIFLLMSLHSKEIYKSWKQI
jgi:hypothetical protein